MFIVCRPSRCDLIVARADGHGIVCNHAWSILQQRGDVEASGRVRVLVGAAAGGRGRRVELLSCRPYLRRPQPRGDAGLRRAGRALLLPRSPGWHQPAPLAAAGAGDDRHHRPPRLLRVPVRLGPGVTQRRYQRARRLTRWRRWRQRRLQGLPLRHRLPSLGHRRLPPELRRAPGGGGAARCRMGRARSWKDNTTDPPPPASPVGPATAPPIRAAPLSAGRGADGSERLRRPLLARRVCDALRLPAGVAHEQQRWRAQQAARGRDVLLVQGYTPFDLQTGMTA